MQATRPHLVRVRGGFKAVCNLPVGAGSERDPSTSLPCGWTSETKRSQGDVLDRLSAHQDMRHESWYGLEKP